MSEYAPGRRDILLFCRSKIDPELMRQGQSWYVYVLECEGGTLYTGVTKDPRRRLTEHRAGGCRYTRARRGIRMLRTRRCATRSRACQYEWALKQLSRKQKLAWCEKALRI